MAAGCMICLEDNVTCHSEHGRRESLIIRPFLRHDKLSLHTRGSNTHDCKTHCTMQDEQVPHAGIEDWGKWYTPKVRMLEGPDSF
jgi:hypothetical protein